MIFVVERDFKPVRLKSGASVAAYATEEKARLAARSLGGTVHAYSFNGATVCAEDLARDVERLRSERDAARKDLADQLDGNMTHRRMYGAHPDETMGMWLARLHRGYREWGRMLEALRDFSRTPTREACDE
jgi:hypothetical protein